MKIEELREKYVIFRQDKHVGTTIIRVFDDEQTGKEEIEKMGEKTKPAPIKERSGCLILYHLSNNKIYTSEEMDTMGKSEKEEIENRSILVTMDDNSIITIPYNIDNMIYTIILDKEDMEIDF